MVLTCTVSFSPNNTLSDTCNYFYLTEKEMESLLGYESNNVEEQVVFTVAAWENHSKTFF